MKPRAVVVELELVTSLPLDALRRADWWNTALQLPQDQCHVRQAQADVVQPADGDE